MFRILRRWKIDLDRTSKYKGQVCISPTRRAAVIYGWPTKAPPADFYLHELLHIALAALRRVPDAALREAEEKFVQDVCKLVRPAVEGARGRRQSLRPREASA